MIVGDDVGAPAVGLGPLSDSEQAQAGGRRRGGAPVSGQGVDDKQADLLVVDVELNAAPGVASGVLDHIGDRLVEDAGHGGGQEGGQDRGIALACEGGAQTGRAQVVLGALECTGQVRAEGAVPVATAFSSRRTRSMVRRSVTD